MAASTRLLSPCLGILVVVTFICLDKVPGCLGTARNLTTPSLSLGPNGNVKVICFSLLHAIPLAAPLLERATFGLK